MRLGGMFKCRCLTDSIIASRFRRNRVSFRWLNVWDERLGDPWGSLLTTRNLTSLPKKSKNPWRFKVPWDMIAGIFFPTIPTWRHLTDKICLLNLRGVFCLCRKTCTKFRNACLEESMLSHLQFRIHHFREGFLLEKTSFSSNKMSAEKGSTHQLSAWSS